ncbi:MAG TPA: M28 family peptidase [Vicinamibacterales bacterium]|nr:M28 family peptidase [Vicinamibacterales bacterium]
MSFVIVLAACLGAGAAARQAPAAGGGLASIQPAELHTWLSYIASDDLNGRRTFSEGLGLAAAYISDHLRAWGLRPAGDDGLYLQRVAVRGIKSTSHSTLTVTVNGHTRTFTDGDGIEFPKNVGAKRRFTADDIEFLGYGLDAPLAHHDDYAGRDVKGKVVVWLGPKGPAGLDQQLYRRALSGRSRFATDQSGALGAIGPELPGRGAFNRDDTPPGLPKADFTTAQRLDHELPPTVTAKDDVLTFLFSAAPASYADLKAKADAGEALPSFRLSGVSLTFTLDDDYEVVRTRYTHNVVAVLEGSDPVLKQTYVAFGAHYDHVGYAQGELTKDDQGQEKRLGAVGRVTDGAFGDRIWNGADDDGSGTVTLLALAKAFATGPRPKRSLLFVWHAGEEEGLWGSRYFVDHPTVPLDRVVTQLNMDMVGRDRDNKASEENTVYIVGSDRISTELHNIDVAADAALPHPLTLDYEMNDPTDLEQVYYRSDHYSYAATGIPIIFFTTGLHPDYHANTDSVDKIHFEKMARIGQLVYETGWRVAELGHAPVRDNKGPRAGKGFHGLLPMKSTTQQGGRSRRRLAR